LAKQIADEKAAADLAAEKATRKANEAEQKEADREGKKAEKLKADA
jgi:hypothetical protein